MLKRNITFEDYDGNEVTKEYYFHLSEAEIIELEVSYKKGLEQTIKDIVAAGDRQTLIAEFKRLILLSYGVREGNRFVKNDELREEFIQTNAYSTLFMELATNDKAAAEFMNGIIPSRLAKAIKSDNPQSVLPPPPPNPGVTI